MVSMFLKRTIAFLADFFVVSAFMWIVSFVLSVIANPYSMFMIYQYFVVVVPILIIIYFVLCEKIKGSTVGKSLMFIEVKSLNGGNITYMQAITRNISKIYWFPIIFDWGIGKILGRDDRILASFSKTIVVEENI
jgi:uncharacterized RDD family membrane protein YckC